MKGNRRWRWRPRSVRGYLLTGIIAPIALFIVIDTFALYRSALGSANTAYDRMLVTTAYSIGDQVRDEERQLRVNVSFATLEVYEAGYSTRMIYKVSDRQGNYIAGDRDLATYRAAPGAWPAAPALLQIYQGRYGSAPVRVAVIAQPFKPGNVGAGGGAVIQVAEPLEFRQSVVRDILWGTVLRQALLLAIISVTTTLAVTWALRPLAALRKQLDEKRDDDLSPLATPAAPRELQPVVAALNQLMARLCRLLDLQQHFVANASHQLRTPLAVLKTQLQSGLRGDAPPETILREMADTVGRATNVANQLLSLAKVEQVRNRGGQVPCALDVIVQEVAIDLSPLISDKDLDFELDALPVWVDGHDWMLSEMISNLLHNAIRHTPCQSRLGIRVGAHGDDVVLCVWDSGPGLAEQDEARVFEAFSTCHPSRGGGLGLTICAEIAASMGAELRLKNRPGTDGAVDGLDARVRFTKSPA